MDLVGSRRRSGGGPKAGSVWERRMKLDEAANSVITKTGNGVISEDGKSVSPNFTGKRKTWKSDSLERSPLRSQFTTDTSELKNSGKIKTKKVVDELKKGVEFQKPESDINAVCEEKEAITSQIKVSSHLLDAEIQPKNEDTSLQKQKQELALIDENKLHVIPTKTNPNRSSSYFSEIPSTSTRLQSYVDLIMWRDVSKSAFVFGIGTFAIISSSFTNNHNISAISVASYMGLLYLSASFLFRSLTNREYAEQNSQNQEYVIGEDDAIWVAKQIAPFVNEFLLKLKALFSGDPVTTMKLAVVLFVLAQFGSSITILKMTKLGFIAVFTLPKIFSSYSSLLTAQGSFWMRRFNDVWKSCSHKKIIGFVIFAFVWNSISVVARIWSVFMIFVAVKGYQQSMNVRDETSKEQDDTVSSEGKKLEMR